jgi:hypothetical protein
MGELLAQTKRAKGYLKRGPVVTPRNHGETPTLSDFGITKRESSEAQKLAAELESKLRLSEAGKKGGRGHKKKPLAAASKGFLVESTRTKTAKAARVSERKMKQLEEAGDSKFYRPPARGTDYQTSSTHPSLPRTSPAASLNAASNSAIIRACFSA